MKKNHLRKFIGVAFLALSLVAAAVPASTSKAAGATLSDYVTVTAPAPTPSSGYHNMTIWLYDGDTLVSDRIQIADGIYDFDILLNEDLRDGYSFGENSETTAYQLQFTNTGDTINISGLMQSFQVHLYLTHDNHVVNNWITVKDATHTEDGLQEGTCKYCNEKQTKKIPALGHDTEFSEWSSDSDSHWHACSCGEALDKEAHTFGDWTITKEATTTEKGIKQRKCTVCNYTESAEIAMIAAPSTKPTTTSTSTSPKASETSETKSASPKTGDNTNIILWSILALISISGVSVCVKRKLTK